MKEVSNLFFSLGINGTCRQDPKEVLAMAFMELSEDTPVLWKDMIGALTCSLGTLHASTGCRIVVASGRLYQQNRIRTFNAQYKLAHGSKAGK